MAATFLDLQSILVTPPTMLQSTRWRNCRCLNKPGGVLCVECHCVMLTIYPFTVSFWLHSSGQAKANCVFFFYFAKWYNLAAIFTAGSSLQGPTIHVSKPGPHHAQTLCFTDFNGPK